MKVIVIGAPHIIDDETLALEIAKRNNIDNVLVETEKPEVNNDIKIQPLTMPILTKAYIEPKVKYERGRRIDNGCKKRRKQRSR